MPSTPTAAAVPAAEAAVPAGLRCCAVLARGTQCTRRSRHVVDGGEHVCGVHRRQREMTIECPICLCVIRKRSEAAMTCGHRFHAKCIRSWFRTRPMNCPMCRAVCLEGMALLGGPRLAPKLRALVRTLPPAPRAFFPSYIVAHLENPKVRDALCADKHLIELLVDLACECFTRDNFFAKITALGL